MHVNALFKQNCTTKSSTGRGKTGLPSIPPAIAAPVNFQLSRYQFRGEEVI